MKSIIKKSVAFLALLGMLMGMCGVSAFAAAVPTVTVGTAQAAPGENVKVDVVLSDCTQFSSYTIQISYESEYLTAVAATEGIDVSLYMPNLSVDGGKTLLVTGGSIDNVTENGAICTLEFAVSADYSGSITEVPLKVTKLKLTEFDGSVDKHIDANGVNGKIVISKTGGEIVWNDSNAEHDLTLGALSGDKVSEYTNPLTGEKVSGEGNYYINEDEKIAIPAEDAEAKLDSEPDNWKVKENTESIPDSSENSGEPDNEVHTDKKGIDTLTLILCIAGGVIIILAAVLAYVLIRKKK